VGQINQAFSQILIRWYERHKRDLPWRETNDPYVIWLSEIILQQTRVAQGLPYFEKFVDRFPTVTSLAEASQEEVLALWQGLGYYSRARNLHACAQMVAAQYNGQFPASYKELLQLKGVGAYTAAAIASFASSEPVPVIDGNVYRVASRVFGLYDDISNASSRQVFEKLLKGLIPADNPGVFNQAIMEFGALHCTPATPGCDTCVFKNTCFAFQNNEVAALPVKTKKVKVINRYFNYFVFQLGDDLLLRQRSSKDIWQGLHDFYSPDSEGTYGDDGVLKMLGELFEHKQWELIDTSATYKHVLTHRVVYARFFRVLLVEKQHYETLKTTLNLRSVGLSQMAEIPKPVLITNYLNDTFF
jgi:A/G-specific adenine glycosylase